MATGKIPELNYTCEICGLEGFTDDKMRAHMELCHLKGAANCPFCDLGEVSPTEMLLHVNTAHLDYLTPSTPDENDMMAFIDDESILDEHNQIERQSTSSSSLYPYIRNGWSTPPNSHLKHCKHEEKKKITASTPALNNNNNGHVSDSTAGPGSPLRSTLNLKLKSHTVPKPQIYDCPMCPYFSDNSSELQEHVNRQHFDLTSPSNSGSLTAMAENDSFNCPICVTSFPNSSELELHVNIEHKDILSPANAKKSYSEVVHGSKEVLTCPICSNSSFKNSSELTIHIEEHFNKKETPSPITPDVSSDRLLAKNMDRHEKEARKVQEQKEFAMLQAQYGMDNQGNFKEQSLTNMQRAVYTGELTVADYYEKQIELRTAEHNGIDDGSSCTKGLIPKIRALSQASSNVVNTWMCTTVDHYAVTYGDKGWGCGYRNTQMMISSLLHHTGYNELIFKAWSSKLPSRSSVPSISKIQRMIEAAWELGFDLQGAEQLGSKLVNTRKWIGATEVVTLFSSLRIKCQLMDFHRPTSSDGGHSEMFKWVLKYFQRFEDFKPPLYLQHQGHSRTIIGIEQNKDNSLVMLVFDPGHNPSQMSHLQSATNPSTAMRSVRVSAAALKARQYQIVAVIGMMDSEFQYQQSKILRSMRIPADR